MKGWFPAKLIINAIDKGNAETQGLLRTLINKMKDYNSKQYCLSEKLIGTILDNAYYVATTVKTGIKEMDLQQEGKTQNENFYM